MHLARFFFIFVKRFFFIFVKIRKPSDGMKDFDRTYAALIHLSQLLAPMMFGHFGLIVPLVMWIIKKDESPFIDRHGRAVINFQLSMLLYGVILVALTVLSFGLALLVVVPLLLIMSLLVIIFAVVGTIRAANGEYYTYPLSIPFI